ncbi:diguanylate cyclase [Sulfurimonas sp.]|uniref:GGDEF domain-containing protein n=1 Tax=Sulfurimonas sp. TaxID=2022749 RepID=UPI0025DFCF07|nr:diguanylate cyclase [Sulfurimonas sp.]MDD5158026.1 diguanylate cyclase [Sulfurimonas sp.]
MLKKDWSVIKITLLLYFVVLLLPLNYYFAKESFGTIRNDARVMNNIVLLSGALPSLIISDDFDKRDAIIKKIDDSFQIIEQVFIKHPQNREYIDLFGADEIYSSLRLSYEKLKVSLKNNSSTKDDISALNQGITLFSKTTQEIMSYKIEVALDKFYISILITMISIIALVFFIRIYMKLQLLKHTVHDHITWLYNKKYFEGILKNATLLAIRQDRSLSLLILVISNYDDLQKSLDKKSFEKNLKELAAVFSHFFRQSDTVCRIEEECFASIMPDATSTNINKLSSRLKQELESKHSNISCKVNVRIGIATFNNESAVSLLDEAKNSIQACNTIAVGGIL